ncbi:uncharacterized protein LOC117081386 [Trachypithecus francoisi]|uniref:uncharacterized protein LOC117081386 n=1 Tax=Trachypithecus francoisi TaxID=54180 RepID=UPI00141BD817|nr:uncharacterized protein LOC117081386 [Trachypithecus francoisi]
MVLPGPDGVRGASCGTHGPAGVEAAQRPEPQVCAPVCRWRGGDRRRQRGGAFEGAERSPSSRAGRAGSAARGRRQRADGGTPRPLPGLNAGRGETVLARDWRSSISKHLALNTMRLWLKDGQDCLSL